MSQRVEKRKLIYHYGDTFDGIDIFWQDKDGNPINLAGYTAQMRIKAKAGGGTGETTVLVLQSGAGLTIDNALGKVTINATPAVMTGGTLAQGTHYLYDIQVKNGQETQTLLAGEFWVDAEVTTD